MNELKKKKSNKLVALWNYFSTYEKIWLFVLSTAGITLAILFPEEQGILRVFEMITLVGGCTCELLLSKQSKWAFIVSFFFYDLTQVVIYMADGYYISALFEVVFWMPMLFISFYSWNKQKDKNNGDLTEVKKINWKRDLYIFIAVLAVSLTTGAIFTGITSISEGLSDWWYIDALANTFSVCNGLFLWLRYKEQWLPWYGVCICETIMWVLTQNWIMLILQLGYLTNTTYGYIKWTKYVNAHKNDNAQEIKSIQTSNLDEVSSESSNSSSDVAEDIK